ncbi:hypothetical protein C7212DRAFT_22977, partial [Tuber magnatum]
VPTAADIGKKLKEVILTHRTDLQKMYGAEGLDNKLKEEIKRGVKMAKELIEDMGCTYEIAKALTVLTLYNVAILIDDSDSIIEEEGGAKKKTLIQYVDNIAKIYSMAKGDGFLALRFMNARWGRKDWAEGSSRVYLETTIAGGVTRIGTELKKKILDPLVIGGGDQKKPLLVLIITDGAAEGEKKGYLKKVIRDCVNERNKANKGFGAVTFQFSRVGNDPGAAKLLKGLDKDPDLGKFIDVLPVEQDLQQQLEDDKWFVLPKILLGGILPD